MIQFLVGFALRFRAIVIAIVACILAGGLYAYNKLDIEAYPNPVPPLVEIITQPDGWSAEEVERYVTIPIETEMNGMLGLDHIRSQSLFGLSDVKCYFNWDTDFYAAQQRVINRLQFLQLPAGAQPQLSPWNAIGEVFRYRVVDKSKRQSYSLTDLKTAEDWILEKQFRQVPGVIDVVGFGGTTKQYHVDIDPYRLRGQGVTLKQVIDAISNSNKNVGGQRLIQGEQSFNVRGVGIITSLDDIRNVVIMAKAGTAIRVRDVADVAMGWAPRLGVVGKDEAPDVVQGIVLMRYGGNTIETLKGVHERLNYIRDYHLLPPEMDIEPYYDRGALVQVTTHTVLHNLLEGMGLVTLVLLLFLGDARSALVTALNIPLALLIAFIGMVSTGTPANLISLGAVDFGIVVDSTVIMMENCFHHLHAKRGGSKSERILRASSEVGQPMFFSTLIIGVAFLPLFTLSGVEGVIFSPMAHTYAFAIGGAICLALTLTPLLASLLPAAPPSPPDATSIAAEIGDEDHGAVHQHEQEEEPKGTMRYVQAFYGPIFRAALRRPKLAVTLGVIPVIVAISLSGFLGKEFMPHLEEGSLWIRATLPMSISLDRSSKYVGRMRQILRSHDEVTAVVSQNGRPDDGTDVSGFYNIELFAPLKSMEEWPKGLTKEKLTDELSTQLSNEFPGVVFNFSQYIQDNVEEALSGVKGENTVKVIGPDLKVNEAKADQIVDVLTKVKGITDLGMLRSQGQPNIKIIPNRLMAGRYGLQVGDVADVVQAAIGGQAVTQVFEGEKRFDLTVRFSPAFRGDLQAIRSILVSLPENGAAVPLGQLAEVIMEEGPSVIFREDNRRYTPVKFSVRGRDLAGTIGEAQSAIAKEIKLPYDTHLEWAGEINELKDATERLIIIVPITLLAIAFLVYTAVKTARDTLIVLGGIPIACTGGILALLITHTNFSVSAAMGFISIFGIAIQDALIVVTYTQRLWADGAGLEEGALVAATRRLRPVLMTTLVAMIGLLPAALSRGIGSETQKPLAIVVIGGALILAIVPRFVQPPLLVLAHRRDRKVLHATV